MRCLMIALGWENWSGIFCLGSIAKREFAGAAALQDLKSEYALSKVAGLLWLAKRQINVDIHEMFLQILLPPGEEKNVQIWLKSLS